MAGKVKEMADRIYHGKLSGYLFWLKKTRNVEYVLNVERMKAVSVQSDGSE